MFSALELVGPVGALFASVFLGRFSSYGGVKIPLQTFNEWIQTPIKISMAIASLKRLQTQLADQQQRAAVHRVQIRQLREELQRSTRRRFIRPTSSHPDHDIS
jgi:hypothetical protein